LDSVFHQLQEMQKGGFLQLILLSFDGGCGRFTLRC